jgi:hypothetical protein
MDARQADLIAIEMVDGQVYAHVSLGSGSIRVKGTSRRADDGLWHELRLSRTGRAARITVDDASADFLSPGGV